MACVAVVQVVEPEQHETQAAGARVPSARGLSTAADSTGHIIAVTAYACCSPGQAISSVTAVDAITPIPLQVNMLLAAYQHLSAPWHSTLLLLQGINVAQAGSQQPFAIFLLVGMLLPQLAQHRASCTSRVTSV